MLTHGCLSVDFDPMTGRLDIHRDHGEVLVRGALVRAILTDERRSTADSDYEHRLDTQRVKDSCGTGRRLEIRSRDRRRQLDLRTLVTCYDTMNAVSIEVACRNVSENPIGIVGIEPLCVLEENGSFLNWPSATHILTNGPMYYDAGRLYRLGEPYREPEPYGPIKGSMPSPDFPFPSPRRIRSWWHVGIFGGYDQEAIVCGFIENRIGLGQLILSVTDAGNLSLYTESVFGGQTRLEPGETVSSGKWILYIAADPYAALEGYADIMGRINHARCGSIVNGWCGWFYTYEFISEEEVLRNAEVAACRLKPFGLEFVQVDEGYQRYHGEWEGNDRFPHGMKWLADRIRGYGLKPGIWIAPFVISEPTDVFRNHPDWLLKDAVGRPMRVGPWLSEGSETAKTEVPKRYCLDISHPEAQRWFFDLFDRAAHEWGYDLFKIDFVAWSILSAYRFHDPGYTPARAYRKGLQLIRDAIGPHKHINECGPGPVTVGLIDSMRIELDQNYGFSKAAWKQYFEEGSSSAPAAAKRYGFHNRTWTNDADHACLQQLSIPQAQAAATLIALSGGNVLSGDRLMDLDPCRMEILRKVFPSYGEAAKPIDLLDSDRPGVFFLDVRKSFGKWGILGLFNADLQQPIRRSIPLARMGLDPKRGYIAYDYWMERLVSKVTDPLEVDVAPGSVTLLAIHERLDRPQVISSDRHVFQGAIELEDVQWMEDTQTLKGVSKGCLHRTDRLTIHLPEAISWAQGPPVLYRDFGLYSVKPVEENLLRIWLRFDDCEVIRWEVGFGGNG
ncbi:MAG: glycoside hydrolase family 36 protein [Thermodesulfobacteriota bacterium]